MQTLSLLVALILIFPSKEGARVGHPFYLGHLFLIQSGESVKRQNGDHCGTTQEHIYRMPQMGIQGMQGDNYTC